MNPFTLSLKLMLGGPETGTVVGVNLGDGRNAPKTQLGMDMVLDNVSSRLAVQKHHLPPYVLKDFVPAILGSAGRRE